MSDDEQLKEDLTRATGKAYGMGTDASEIVSVLEGQIDRWQVVAETESE